MKEKEIVYGFDVWEDYDGGGTQAVFSTFEKALEYAEKYRKNQSSLRGTSLTIIG